MSKRPNNTLLEPEQKRVKSTHFNVDQSIEFSLLEEVYNEYLLEISMSSMSIIDYMDIDKTNTVTLPLVTPTPPNTPN